MVDTDVHVDTKTHTLEAQSLETGHMNSRFAEHLRHWRCHRDHDNVQWWLLDCAESSTNTLSQAVLTELDELVTNVERTDKHQVRGIVIRSAKDNGFIAGAEIGEFRGITDPRAVADPLRKGAKLLERLAKLHAPTIAVVHGFCLGAGLELALACKYRLARSDSKLGFPEVLLGLHPGLGGTVRLTRQIRPTEALNLMLTGKSITAAKAKQVGLVDAVCEERHFARAIEQAVAGNLSRRGRDRVTHLMQLPPVARTIAHFAEKKTRSRVNEQRYPAPFALLKLWRKHSAHPRAMAAAERESFAQLLTSETAQNLVRVFFLREALKNVGKGDAGIHHVHVVGAGTMGGDIASWFAVQGLQVTLEDRAPRLIAPAIKRAHQLVGNKLRSSPERQAALDRLIPDLSGSGRKRADLIIEAIPERIELKSKVLKDIEASAKKDAIIATNTSSIVLENLRGSLQDPGRFIGIHFFNPVSRMQLVEVVTHDQVSADTVQRASSFIHQLDRLPVAVKSAPGFLVNRVLTPYLLEALALIDEGHSKEAIDQAGIDFGMPMGPIELADLIGLDICLHVAETLHMGLDQELYPIPQWLYERVDNGEFGKKAGQGLYRYKNGKAQKAKHENGDNTALQQRLILPMLNTCVRCLDEGIVKDPNHLDGAVIFATGFAPFTGGPLHYSESRGIETIVQQLIALQREHGDRFKPAAGWHTHFIQADHDHDNEQGFRIA